MNEHPSLPRRVWADEITDSSSCTDQIELADQNDWHPARRRKMKRRRVRFDQNLNAIGSLPLNLLTDVSAADNHPSVTVSAVVLLSSAAYPASILSRPSYTAAAQSAPQSQPATHRLQQQPQPQQRTQCRKQRPVIVGRSRSTATSHAGNSSHITAAKLYISKASLCIDNVSTDVSELAMAIFVAAMDTDVLGCYSVKPRRSPYQRIHSIEPQDRKAFRLCIPREDSARFLDAKKWPAHISVSHWIFKKKSTQSEDVHDAASSSNGRSKVVGLSTAETASACHTDAMSAAGSAESRRSASSSAE